MQGHSKFKAMSLPSCPLKSWVSIITLKPIGLLGFLILKAVWVSGWIQTHLISLEGEGRLSRSQSEVLGSTITFLRNLEGGKRGHIVCLYGCEESSINFLFVCLQLTPVYVQHPWLRSPTSCLYTGRTCACRVLFESIRLQGPEQTTCSSQMRPTLSWFLWLEHFSSYLVFIF